MKKVLIITDLNPHLERTNSRCRGLAKYLSHFGWQPTFLTIPVDQSLDAEIIEVPYRGDIFRWLRKGGFKKKGALNKAKQINSSVGWLFNLYRALFGFPDDIKRWKKPALKSAVKLAENFDAIISSSSPVTAHVIAYQLKKKFNLPWIADLRDLWTQNHNYPFPWWRKMIDKWFELKTLKTADALVAVSNPWKDKLSSLHKKEVQTITNGFDSLSSSSPNGFIITYAGTLYPQQDPENLLIALKDFDDIELRFYCGKSDWLEKKIKEQGLKNVKVYDKISREDILTREKESQLLLLLSWDEGCYPLKIFEYLACQRPILAISRSGVVNELIAETKTGVCCNSVEEIKSFLKKAYLEYIEIGVVSYNGDLNKINKYSHKEMARKFSDILNGITQTKGN